VDVRGTVNGDVVAFGNTITISGHVRGNVVSGASTTTIDGQVDGTVRSAAGTVVIDGQVAEDVLVGAGSTVVSPDARIGRDLWLGTGNADIRGPVQGEVMAGAGQLTLSAPVNGTVRAQAERLVLTDRASVGGDLVYSSPMPASIAAGANVAGTIERTDVMQEAPSSQAELLQAALVGWLRALVGFLVLGLLLALVFPQFSGRAVHSLARRPLPTMGVGLAAVIGAPLVGILLLVVGIFVGGWWLGLLTLAAYALVLAVSVPIAGLFVGRWLLSRIGQRRLHAVWALVLGLALLLLLTIVPWVGLLVILAAMLAGTGALATAMFDARPGASAAEEAA